MAAVDTQNMLSSLSPGGLQAAFRKITPSILSGVPKVSLDPKYMASSSPSTAKSTVNTIKGLTPKQSQQRRKDREAALSLYTSDADATSIVESLDDSKMPDTKAYLDDDGDLDEGAYKSTLDSIITSTRKERGADAWKRLMNNDEDYASLVSELAHRASPVQTTKSMPEVYKAAPDAGAVQVGSVRWDNSHLISSVLERDDSVVVPDEYAQSIFGREGLDESEGGYIKDRPSKAVFDTATRLRGQKASKLIATMSGGMKSTHLGTPSVPISTEHTLDEFPTIASYGMLRVPRPGSEAPEKGSEAYNSWISEQKAFKKAKLMTPWQAAKDYPALSSAFTLDEATAAGTQDDWVIDHEGISKDGRKIALSKTDRDAMSTLIDSVTADPLRPKTKEEKARAKMEEQINTRFDPLDGLRIAPFTLEEAASKRALGLTDGEKPDQVWSYREKKKDGTSRVYTDLASTWVNYPLLAADPYITLAQDYNQDRAATGTGHLADWTEEYLTKYRKEKSPWVVLTEQQKSELETRVKASTAISVGDRLDGCKGGCGPWCGKHGQGRATTGQKGAWDDSTVTGWQDSHPDFTAHKDTGMLNPDWKEYKTKSERTELFGTVDKNSLRARTGAGTGTGTGWWRSVSGASG